MRQRMLRGGGLVVLAAAAALVVGTVPASAATGGASAYGAQVQVSLLGQKAVDIPPTPSVTDTDNPSSKDLAHLNVNGVLHAKALAVKANKNTSTGEVTSSASVGVLNLPLLAGVADGVPTAKAITATCDATTAGITGKTTIASLNLYRLGNGAVGDNIAPDTTIALKAGDVNIATLILNEQIHNSDGSLTVNAIHIRLLGAALAQVAKGDIILSSATCGPAAPPTALASGAGLWIGLGLLGAVAVPTGVAVSRKRKAHATAAV
ncbi:MAG: choice-of-anchor P family protein [Sciscionella sp.]